MHQVGTPQAEISQIGSLDPLYKENNVRDEDISTKDFSRKILGEGKLREKE